MKNLKYRALLSGAVLLHLFLFSCDSSKEYGYDASKIPAGGILMQNWHVVGPFDKSWLDKDDLQDYDLDENKISFIDFTSFAPSDTLIKSGQIASASYKVDFFNHFGCSEDKKVSGNVYAGCNIKSKSARTVKLNFSTVGGFKLWLNNELIHTESKFHGIKNYEYYFDLNLRKGDNFLMAKVGSWGGDEWEMFSVLENESEDGLQRYRSNFDVNYGNEILRKTVFKDDTLQLNEFLPTNRKYSYKIEGLHDAFQEVENFRELVVDISSLPEGVHLAYLQADGEIVDEKFFKGDLIASTKRLIEALEQKELSSTSKRNVNALIHRFEHITKPQHLPGGEPWLVRSWDKRLLYVYLGLKANLDLADKKGTLRGVLNSYVSEIDGGTQYYQLFVPDGYQETDTLPLMVEFPTFMARHGSPLETHRFANINLLGIYADLANKHKVIILETSGRTVDLSNRNTIEETDIFENIEDVRKNHNIDPKRIYIRGSCFSARDALKIATKYPDRFAALSLVSPQLELAPDSEKNFWLKQGEPIHSIKNLVNMPVLNIHSRIDTHSPIQYTEALMGISKGAGLKLFQNKVLPYEFKLFYTEEHLDEIIGHLKQFRLNDRPEEVYFSTYQLKYNRSFWVTLDKINIGEKAELHASIKNNVLKIDKSNVESYTIDLTKLPYDPDRPLTIVDNKERVFKGITTESTMSINPVDKGAITKNSSIEGPFAHIFTKPFIIVPGTTGSGPETTKLQAMADTIRHYWEQRYFEGCRVVPDNKITEAELQNYHLLLLGNPGSNQVLQKYKDKVPFGYGENHVTIGQNRYKGNRLNYYWICPNPDSPGLYLANIGYNGPRFIDLGHEGENYGGRFKDVSDYGWYDYKLWDFKQPVAITKGYFDFYWR